jgi:dTDP-4-amino-4,6-dideoxygalactose transaminase
LPGLESPPGPDGDPRRFDIFQNYEVCCDRRDELRAHLLSCGVGTIVQWGGAPLHQFRNLGFDQELPRADRFAARSLLLPMNHLLTDVQVGRVIEAVRGFLS